MKYCYLRKKYEINLMNISKSYEKIKKREKNRTKKEKKEKHLWHAYL